MAGVLPLDAVVPGEEGQTQARNARLLDLQQAVFQLLPEAGRGPVLDREAGPLGDARVLAAVEPLQLVVAGLALAEPARVGVAGDDAVVHQVAVHLGEEVAKVLDLFLGQLALAQPLLDAGGDGQRAGACGESLRHIRVTPVRIPGL